MPPKAFRDHCAARVGATFDNAPKAAMREALLHEQEGLCAYCMGELAAATEALMKVEHHVAQSADPARALDWDNLLGVCKGNEGKPRAQQTCDTRRGNRPLPLDPKDEAIERQVAYERSSGRIVAVDPDQQGVFDDVLGLNVHHVVQARAAVLEAFFERMRRAKPQGTWTQADYELVLDAFRKNRRGTTRGYIGIVEWAVRQRSRKSVG